MHRDSQANHEHTLSLSIFFFRYFKIPSLFFFYKKIEVHQQGNMIVEEYTREFEKFFIKCDIPESKDQTIVRYLGGLNPRYSNVVELQQYSTFDDVSLLAHRVK